MFVSAFPILVTPDLRRALAFYRDLLGASVDYQFPDDGDPQFVTLEIGSSRLGLGQADADTGEQRGNGHQPLVRLDHKGLALLRHVGATHVHVSLSHTETVAMAVAALEISVRLRA